MIILSFEVKVTSHIAKRFGIDGGFYLIKILPEQEQITFLDISIPISKVFEELEEKFSL